MKFPNENDLALCNFIRHLIDGELHGRDPDEETPVPIGWLRALAFGPGMKELKVLGAKQERKGITAGLTLALVFMMEKNGIDRPSVNKAARIIEELSTQRKKAKVPYDHYSDRAEIVKAWNEMRPCAHLWAAIEILDITGVINKVTPGEEGWNTFLNVAAGLHEFGCNFFVSNTKKAEPLLEQSSNFNLKGHSRLSPISFDSIVIPTWMQSILTDYRAPQSL